MTVGISFTNGVEAMVIADSRISGPSRQSDSVNKLGEFRKEGYYGFVAGSGSSNLVEGLYVAVPGCEGENLEAYLAQIQGRLRGRLFQLRDIHLQAEKEKIIAKSNLIPNEEDRKRYLEQGIGKLLQDFDKLAENPSLQVHFVVTAYDRQLARLRHFSLDQDKCIEQFTPEYLTGSGTDGAHLYFAGTLQGLEIKSLQSSDLLFHAMNAYAHASINVGVGGTPKIAHVSSEGNRMLSVEQARLLTNISGAYTSRYSPTLTPDRMKRYCGEVLEGRTTSLINIARMLNMTPDSLTTMAIPYSVWQERANSQ